MAINTTPPEGYVPSPAPAPSTPPIPTPPGVGNSPASANTNLPGVIAETDQVRQVYGKGMNVQRFWPIAATGTAGSVTTVSTTIVEGGGGGGGTTTGVISVAALGTTEITATVTLPYTTPLITLTSNAQSANNFWGGPTSGSAAVPAFRAIVPADLPVATTSALGVVKPDGTTVLVSSGAISVPTATSSTLGLVKPDNSTITISGGVISGAAAGVTSVALSAPTEFTVSGSPVTTTGTLTFTKNTQSANLIYAGPTTGSAAAPTFRAAVTADIPSNLTKGGVGVSIQGVSVPNTGLLNAVQIPYSGTITGWTIITNSSSGSAQFDVKKSTYSGYPTTTSIVASAPPLVSSAQKATSTTLTGWTTTVTAGDMIELYLTSVSTATILSLILDITRT